MPARFSRPAALIAGGILALALVGCGSAAPQPAETTGAPAPDPTTTSDSQPTPTTAPTVDPVDVTCESLVNADTRASLTAQGWSFKEEPLVIGETTIKDGISCMWADFEIPGGPLMIFGWGPIDAAEAKKATDGLVATGWRLERDPAGDYVTEDPEQAPTTDDEGYGLTYQFGDGWVTVADTKQNLLLIDRPGA